MATSSLVSAFRKEVSKLKDQRMKSESEFNVGYSTGFLCFDFINGSMVHVKTADKNLSYYSLGITDGSMNMVIGRSGCGKTTWCIQSAANIVRNFDNGCIFHDDIEGGITMPRLTALTGFTQDEVETKYILRNTGITAENFYARIKMIYDIKMADPEKFEYDTGLYDYNGNRIFKLQPTVVILDSLALLMPEKLTEEEELSGSMSATAAAKTNSSVFKRVVPMLKSGNIILFVINHINKKIDINPMQRTKAQVSYLKQDESLPAGNTPIYLANNLIRFDDHTKLKSTEGFGIDGTLVDVTLIKSRTARAGQVATLVFDQNTGFDPDLSLLILLKKYEKLNGAGAYMYIGDHQEFKFAQKNFKELLKNPEFMEIVMEAVKEILPIIIPPYEELECTSNNSMSTKLLMGLTTPQ